MTDAMTGRRWVWWLMGVMGVMGLMGCSSVEPGNDPVVVRAEQITATAFDAMDAFLFWESRHPVPDEIHEFAERLRRDAPQWFGSARALTRAYKSHRTEENKVALETVLALLETAVSESAGYMAKPPE